MELKLFTAGHVLFEMATGREVGKYPPAPDEWEDVTNRDLQEVSSILCCSQFHLICMNSKGNVEHLLTSPEGKLD